MIPFSFFLIDAQTDLARNATKVIEIAPSQPWSGAEETVQMV
jgi:hypothetical protein